MGKQPLRIDQTCLNCKHVVANRFCPNCGQENIESRKTFHHLFVHFFEDLTHYENAFWRTIKNLLGRPGALTKQYLSGKRMSYLAPVRLYIFISFVTFFLISVLPSSEATPRNDNVFKYKNGKRVPFGLSYSDETDTVTVINPFNGKVVKSTVEKENNENGIQIGDYDSVKQLDSIQNATPVSERHGKFIYWIEKKLAEINEKSKSDDQFKHKFKNEFIHNIPKALFLYMPFFAFWLWLIHSKKKWYYFDHGIFTLHYFSFLLFTLSIQLILNSVHDYTQIDFIDSILTFTSLFLLCWWFFYFFRSHRRFYGESRAVSRLKGFMLFFINMFFIFVFIIGLMMFSAVSIE